MARNVFFSFHYGNDIFRVNQVRNSWVTQGKQAAGFIDKAEFEKVERNGQKAIENWIDRQLDGTSVTVVLIGEKTLGRPYVQYEIRQSVNRGNAIIGVQIHSIPSITGICLAGNINTIVGVRGIKPIRFSDIADGIYNYKTQDGYHNLGKWVESAAIKHGK